MLEFLQRTVINCLNTAFRSPDDFGYLCERVVLQNVHTDHFPLKLSQLFHLVIEPDTVDLHGFALCRSLHALKYA